MADKKKARMYVTKQWETKGIRAINGSIDSFDPRYFQWNDRTAAWHSDFVRIGAEAFESEEEARAHVRVKALRKIAGLEKRIARLKGML